MIAAKNGNLTCVKLLVCQGADLHCTTYRGGQELGAWQIAKRANRIEVAQYLQQCLGVLQYYDHHGCIILSNFL